MQWEGIIQLKQRNFQESAHCNLKIPPHCLHVIETPSAAYTAYEISLAIHASKFDTLGKPSSQPAKQICIYM